MTLPTPRWVLAVAAVAASVAIAAVVADAGRAQETGATYLISYGKSAGALDDLRPKGAERARISVGDQFFIATAITRHDKVRGTLIGTYTAGDRKPVAAGKSRGLFTGVYRFPDGDLFVSAGMTFDDGDADHGAITGGTGAYEGAQGTVESSKTRDIVRLAP